LKHDELVTLFHELGHGIHDLVAKTTYSRFHGFETVVDFGEAPSQMLENWCWTASCLKMLSKHYSSLSPEYLESWKQEHGKQILDSRPPVQISDDVISSLIEAKHINSAIFNLRQVAFAVFSMAIHHPESHDDLQQMNVAKEFNEIRRRIIPLAKPESPEGRDEWGHGAGKFGHVMMEDYDACYYSYLL
jgi:metallopeptidase MepB